MALDNQTFVNLERDADDTGKFVNTKQIITPRYGNPFKSAPLVSEEMEIKADEVVAKGFYLGFANEAAMRAYTPSFAETRAKLDDTKKVYRWERTSAEGVTPIAGIWHDTGLSELDQANQNLKAKVDITSDAIHTHILVDVDQKRMFAVQKDGGLKAVGLDGTVQEEIINALLIASRADSNLENRVTISSDAIHTLKHSDANNMLMFAVQKDGGIKFVGFEQTLQEVLADLYAKTEKSSVTLSTNLALLRDKKDVFTTEAQEAMNMQRFANINAAPAPLDLHQRKYTISDTWLNEIKFSKPASKTVINTPYRNNDGVVHPHLIEFYNGFRGYRYLLKVEPYYNTGEQYENPCIYGSNDLIKFDLLDGFTQPLASRPVSAWGQNHNSDGVFAYDPRTGDLILVWRETWRNWENTGETRDAWAMRKTKDGYTWTDKEYLLNPSLPTEFPTAAPAILYDPKKDEWHIYIGTGSSVKHYVKKELTSVGWEAPTLITAPSDLKAWHVDCRYVGNKIVILVHDQTNGQFRFGISDDFVNFKWAIASNYTEVGTLDMYKATFRPKFNAQNEMAFDVIYTSRFDSTNIDERWNLFVTQTNYVNVNLELI